MKVTGQRKLIKQLKKMPVEVRDELEKATTRSSKRFANFARRLAPVASGESRDAINSQVVIADTGVMGFVNFNRGTYDSAIRQASISYGRSKGDRGTTGGYQYIQTTRNFIGKKYQRAVARAIKIGLEKS